jgi:hypothetical protein
MMVPAITFLPDSIENSTKVRMVSGQPHKTLPAAIDPIPEEIEKKIVTALLTEINELYSMNLYTDPDLARSSTLEGKEFESPKSRVFVVGASHLKRVVGSLANHNFDVVDLSRAGWVANETSLTEVASKLEFYQMAEQDVVLIDLLSNSVFCGTDTKGNLLGPEKTNEIWHIPGDLAFTPKTVLKAILNDATQLLFTSTRPELIAMIPVPRYVAEKCCKDPGHIKNINAPDYLANMEKTLTL